MTERWPCRAGRRGGLGAVLLTAAIPAALAAQATATAGRGDLGAVLERIRVEQGLPALAAVSVAGGRIVDLAAVGLRAADSSLSVQATDRWHIGSLTKAMTATIAALVVEQGDIRWTTTVAEALPDLAAAGRAEYRDVRLEELLHHTSGLPADIRRVPGWQSYWMDQAPLPEQRRHFVRDLLAVAPEGPRGEYRYANAGYVLAGAILEAATGRSWESLITEMVFAPLEMDSSGFGAPGRPGLLEQPRGHRMQNGLMAPAPAGPGGDNPAMMAPAGTVHVTLADYARFMMAHLGDEVGGVRLLDDEALSALHTSPEGGDYAMGWAVSERPWAGGRVLRHAGSNTMWYAVVWLAPERDLGILAVTNVAGDAAVAGTDAAAAALIRRLEGE